MAFFFAAIINSGTLKNYSYELGRFEKKRAGEFFFQGTVMAISVGIIMTALMLLLKPYFYEKMLISGEIRYYLDQYYDIIVFFILFVPISSLLDNIVVSDGGERLSAFLNISQIIGNVVLSIVLASKYGVAGIALATVICKVAFVLLIFTWFLRKSRTVQFSPYFSLKDLVEIVRKGIVRASTYLTTMGLNMSECYFTK